MRKIIAIALAAAATQAHAVELLVNGSFEAPVIGQGSYYYPGGAYGGWVWSATAVVGGGVYNPWYGGNAPAGVDGTQFAALQGTGSIAQTFTAVSTGANLSWLAGGRPYFGGYDGDQTYQVLLGSTVIGTYSTVSGQAFSANSASLSGLTVGQSYTLTFKGLATTDQTAFIDGVSLASAGAVPEPGSWALMILGSGGAGAMLRRPQRRTLAAA